MRAASISVFCFCLPIACVGCAHHKADQYALAPPYAPPVYPQPQGPQQTVVAGGPNLAAPVVAGVPAPVGMPAAVMAGAPCDPAGTPVAFQGSPCPPGETIVAGSMVGGEMPCEPGP
ncbi:MAG: hypothetical protein ACKOYJ_03980 [Planctomycetia bacterium]